jgi:hypothetical protein
MLLVMLGACAICPPTPYSTDVSVVGFVLGVLVDRADRRPLVNPPDVILESCVDREGTGEGGEVGGNGRMDASSSAPTTSRVDHA